MSSAQKIGFIGAGNMAEAIISGLAGNNNPELSLYVSDPHQERLDCLAKAYQVRRSASNTQLVKDCDIIVLAIKPQITVQVLSEIYEAYTNDKLLVAVMAGIPTSIIEGFFPTPPRLVRAMPNTPALIGEGATALCTGSAADEADMQIAKNLFSAIGRVFEVSDEVQMDAVTGLSGSGPAYVYSFIEAMADAGVLKGLPRQTALGLAVQTVLGAAALVRKSAEHPAQLRDKVCSPGGTTITGVKALEANAFRNSVMEAVCAAAEKARELGKS